MDITINGGALASLIGMSETELTSRLRASEDSEDLLPPSEASNVVSQLIGEKMGKLAKEKVGQGSRTTAVEFEKRLKSLIDGFDSETTGADLVNEVFDAYKANLKPIEKVVTKEKELTMESLAELAKDDTVVKQFVQSAIQKVESERDEALQRFEDYKAERDLRLKVNAIKEHATKVLVAANARLGEKEDEREKRLGFFFKGIDPSRVMLDEEGNPYPVDKDGKRLQDDHYNDISFKQWILNENPYGVHEHDPSKNSPQPGQQHHRQTSGGFNIKSVEDYMRLRKEYANDRDKLAKLNSAWQSAKPSISA